MNELIVETVALNFSYSKGTNDISDFNLKIPKGSIYGFLGPNGSGKTTTIRLLLGLLQKKTGEIKLFDTDFLNNRIKSLAKIGALIENPSLYEHLSARDNLKIAATYRGDVSKDRIEEVLEIVKLSDTKHKKVKAFSLGMKQRLGLAIALLSKPELLILDEPTNGLDPKGIIEMRDLIKDLNHKWGTTILISSHLLVEIEKICTHVGIINKGKILFQDTVKALKESKSEKITLEIETDNTSLLETHLQASGFTPVQIDQNILEINVKHKKEIPLLIDDLRNKSISIYQLKIKDNLEELFLSLTAN